MTHTVLKLVVLAIASGAVWATSSISAEPELDAKSARAALSKWIEKDHHFSSPGKTESRKEFMKSVVVEVEGEDDEIMIGRFFINLSKKTYVVSHSYGSPGSGFFETWAWKGTFSKNKDGVWLASEPESIKYFGR